MLKSFLCFSVCILVIACEGTAVEPVTLNATCTIRRSGADVLADVTLKNTGNRAIPSAGEICASVEWTAQSTTLYGNSGIKCVASVAAGQTLDMGEEKINLGSATNIAVGTPLSCKVYNYNNYLSCPTAGGTCVDDIDHDLTIKNDTTALIVP